MVLTNPKNHIWKTTGFVPAVYDKGTHYVTNMRLTLEILKALQDFDFVLEVTGDYTGTLTGRGASHEPRHIDKDNTDQNILKSDQEQYLAYASRCLASLTVFHSLMGIQRFNTIKSSTAYTTAMFLSSTPRHTTT